jgi:hypothetical protein
LRDAAGRIPLLALRAWMDADPVARAWMDADPVARAWMDGDPVAIPMQARRASEGIRVATMKKAGPSLRKARPVLFPTAPSLASGQTWLR